MCYENKMLVEYTESQIGRPFLHHFKPNLCEGGMITLPDCMERGMDKDGYDCMGLVIYGICRILGIRSNSWPSGYRHNLQLYEFASDDKPIFGDIVLIESYSESTGIPYITHSGIYIDENLIIHANGKTGIVDKSPVMGVITKVTSLSTAAIIGEIEGKLQ